MRWGWLALAALAPCLQSTLLYRVLPGGSTPDLVQAITVAAAVNGGILAGVVFGFLGGLSLALVQQGHFGALTSLYLLVGWAIGIYSDVRRPLRRKELLLFSGLASLAVWAAHGRLGYCDLASLAPQMLWQTLLLAILVPLTRK